eukprot:gene14683-biopygen11781
MTPAVLNPQKRVDIIDQFQSRFANARLPTYKKLDARRLGRGEPGSELWNFSTRNDAYHFIQNASIEELYPSTNQAPKNNKLIQFTFSQEPGLFIDTRNMIVKMKTRMEHNGTAWTAQAPAAGYQKNISPINNVGPSLFKHINSRINNQNDETIAFYSEIDYEETVNCTPTDVYQNGDLTKKGFFKETPGFLNETKCWGTAEADPPTNTTNPARARLCSLYYQGATCELQFRLNLPLNKSQVPFNASNKLELIFQRHEPAYYLMCTTNGAAQQADQPADLVTYASSCYISIEEMKIEYTTMSLVPERAAEYISKFTNESPDEFPFTHHSIDIITPQLGVSEFKLNISQDKLPDKTSFQLRHRRARLGDITMNPYRSADFTGEWIFLINSSNIRKVRLKTQSEAYDALRETINPDLNNPLVTRDDFLVTNSGYSQYADTLTFTCLQQNQRLSEDQRSAGLSLYLKVPNNGNLPGQHDIQIAECIRKDPYHLARIYAGVIAEDDIAKILANLGSFRDFLVTSLLQRNIHHFPLAYIMNTGTHKNGGRHWQALYFDHDHNAFFFDSYGRQPSDAFKSFAEHMLSFSYLRRDHRLQSLDECLSTQTFTPQNYRLAQRTQALDAAQHATVYFPWQIQSDDTNVCGEYSVLFLFAICRTHQPRVSGYNFWYDPENNFYRVRPDSRRKQKDALVSNDKRVRTRFLHLFNFPDPDIFK